MPTAFHLTHPARHAPYEAPAHAARPPSRFVCLLGFILAAGLALCAGPLKEIGEHADIPEVALAWALPFLLLLGSIALFPILAHRFWERHYPKIALLLGAVTAIYYAVVSGRPSALAETLVDYLSFIYLLGSLFVVSGGIMIRVRARSTPLTNTILLVAGGLLANVLGTTGAAMLLIRPFLILNGGRFRPYHMVFFIFLVANVGGSLTPIGDPPLFLGYLRGVPFWWVLEHCWAVSLTALGCLAVIFFCLDSFYYRRAAAAVRDQSPEAGPVISLLGAANILFLGLILVGVFLDTPYREILMAAAAFGSLALTPRRIYGENNFNFAPIKEVAILFLGIFVTMVPAMNYLHHHSADPRFARYLNNPAQFYFTCGSLSSVLDNAPTYATFFETARGKLAPHREIIEREQAVLAARRMQLNEDDLTGLSADQQSEMTELHGTLLRYRRAAMAAGELPPEAVEVAFLLDDSGRLKSGGFPMFQFLIAISMGAVFFGAATYIGNGPNFMIKSIVDHAGFKTPSFSDYILYYTCPFLLPVLIFCYLLYLRT